MAIARKESLSELRYPAARTPDIPEACQWAIIFCATTTSWTAGNVTEQGTRLICGIITLADRAWHASNLGIRRASRRMVERDRGGLNA